MSKDLPPASDKAKAAALVGKVIADRYRLVDLVAVGGMGAVFKGEHVRMRKRLAIKVLLPEMTAVSGLVDRFEREAVAGAHIDHPNVASATDFGEFDDGWYYLALEWVKGRTLADAIADGAMPVGRAVNLTRQIAAGLGAGHKMGIVHRDVKPRNIMLVDGDPEVIKLIDYGFACVPLDRLSASTDAGDIETMRITASGVAFGTVAYMAPEIAEGMERVDERSDLYSTGILFYEMLTGKHPFDGVEAGELFLQQRKEQPPPLRLRNREIDVPPEVESIVMKLLRKEPTERFQSADDLLAELQRVVPIAVQTSPGGLIPWTSQLPGSTPHPTSSSSAPPGNGVGDALPPPPPLPEISKESKPPASSRGRSPWTLVVLALGAVVVSIILVLTLRDIKEQPPSPAPSPQADDQLIDVDLTSASASASSSASAAPTAEPETREIVLDIDGKDAPAWKVRLGNAFVNKEWSEGADAILALALIDPDSFQQESVRIASTAVVVRIEHDDPERATKVFDALANDVGPAGVDVLYQAVSGYGGSDGAKRALVYLQKEDVVSRGSEAVQIAIELRLAPCAKKPQLFDRAAMEGDERALAVLGNLQGRSCHPSKGHCCFHKDERLKAAARKLKARLKL